MLSRAIPSFRGLYPELRLILVSINDPAQIADEGTDVFIRPRSLRQRGGEHKPPQALIVRKLAESPMVTCASPEYLKRVGVPRTPADLAQHTCAALLTLERDVQDEWRFAKRDKRETIRFTPKLIADGETLREIALAGCGIARNLACNIEDEMRSGALVRVLPDWECLGSLPIVATYRKSTSTLPRINAFLRHLAQTFQRATDASLGRT
jgi:DNA-binding transcriptional LysR family regulator